MAKNGAQSFFRPRIDERDMNGLWLSLEGMRGAKRKADHLADHGRLVG